MEHKYWGVLRSVIPPLGVEGVEAGDCCLDQQARPQRPQWLVDDDTYGNLDAAGIAQLLESYA